MPVEKYSRAPEILRPQPRHRRALRPLHGTRCFQTEVTELRWDEAAARWIVSHQSRRRDARALRGHGQRPAASARSCPASPASRRFKGHTFHTSRWDYDYTGGDSNGGLDGLKDKRVGDHRHRRDGRAVRAAPGRGGQGALRLPAHALVHRRARQPADRSGLGRRGCSPAGSSERMDNFNILVSGGFQEEDLVNDGWTDIIRNLLILARKRPTRPAIDRGAGRDHAAGRLPEDGADPRAGGPGRQGPGDRRGAEALVQPVLQAAVLPRRISGRLQPAERHPGRHRRPGRRAITENGDRRQRPGIRDRLPDLRHRLRGRHRLHPPLRLRGLRPRRR